VLLLQKADLTEDFQQLLGGGGSAIDLALSGRCENRTRDVSSPVNLPFPISFTLCVIYVLAEMLLYSTVLNSTHKNLSTDMSKDLSIALKIALLRMFKCLKLIFIIMYELSILFERGSF